MRPTPFPEVLCLFALVLASSAAAVPDGNTGAQPTLEVLGAHATDGVEVSLSGPELNRELRIQSITAAPVEALRVIVGLLRDERGHLLDVSWDLGGKGQDTPVLVPAFGHVTLALKARLPQTGTYTGDIFLIYGKAPQRLRLSVTHGPEPLHVDVLGLEPVTGTAAPWGGSQLTLQFTVQEISGQDITLDPASLVGLSRVTRSSIQFQTPFGLNGMAPTELKGSTSRQVQLTVTDLEGAGEYKGTLRLFAKDRQPVDREVRLFLKEHWLVALFCICLGVGTSLLLRWVLQRFRPRLEAQQNVLFLRHELEQETEAMHPLDDTERRVLAKIMGEMDWLVARVGIGMVKQGDMKTKQDQLQRKGELFTVWLYARRQVLGTHSAGLQKNFDERLSKVEVLLTGSGATENAFDDARKDLEAIPSEFKKLVRDELDGAIAQLTQAVNAQLESSKTKLAQRLRTEVSPELAISRECFDGKEIEKARSAYTRAHRAYLELLAENLAAQLSGDPPHGVEQSAWNELRGRVLAELGAARKPDTKLHEAFSSYERAHRIFLTAVTRALLESLPGFQKAVEQSDLGTDDKALRKTMLEEQVKPLNEVLGWVREGLLPQAAEQYARVSGKVLEATTGPKVRGKLEKPSLVVGSPAAPKLSLFEAGSDVVVSHARARSRPVTLGTVSRWRMGLDLGISVFLAVVAGMIGVQALWANDLTWGGWTAYVTAFLWGLGLHQATFGTLSGLAESIVGKKEFS
jgi:hypothetical protein